MAAIHDLLAQVQDEALRARLEQEINRLTKQKKFGLVFEEHLPECTPLYDVPVKRGANVAKKTGSVSDMFEVLSIKDGMATCMRKVTEEKEIIPVRELVCVAQFGEPIYPYLKPLDSVCNAPVSDLWHTLIEADNYHALQLLEYLYAGKVDCIYIDPPYNTGAKDWKYNNDYVDGSDAYRHSKWLSFMEKRLKLAKKLLNPSDSVMIVTIDEKEYLHLGCLLEELFPEARIQMISSVISSQGSTRDGLFSRADEYLFFVFLGNAEINKSDDDMLNEGQSATKSQLWFQFVRTGKGNLRENSKNLFYPIFVDSEKGIIKKIGDPIPLGIPKETVPVPDGLMAIWPMTSDGREARWRTGVDVANRRLAKGLLRLGKTTRKESGWSVLTVNEGTEKRIEKGEVVIDNIDETGAAVLKEKSGGSLRAHKTVWNKTSHNAGWHGSKLLAKILIDRKFPYPKSLYAVEDTLRIVTKKTALIVDFFAGSGTTLHATALLNAEDGGKRRCIIVTNNEVSEEEAKSLVKKGYNPGETSYEAMGIAQYVTWPRTVGCIKGCDVKGKALEGEYLGSNISMSDGFRTNAAFFKLGFLDKTAVSLGSQLAELIPVLWLKAGAHGACPELKDNNATMMIQPENKFAILIDEKQFSAFEEEMQKYPEIQTIYFVTDSDPGYREMIKGYADKDTYQLYRDYLDNFRINTRR